MNEHRTCPGCARHCAPTDLHCGKGEAYFRRERLSSEPPGLETRNPLPRQSLTINDRLIDALRDLSRMMRAQYEGRASQKRILMILRETEAITQRDLTERLGIQPGSASEILAKLENAGLIARTPNTEDRRTTDIHLTEPGRSLALEAAGQRRARHEEMFSCLSEEEKQTLLALLERLCGDWAARYREPREPLEASGCPEEPFGRRGGHHGRPEGHHGGHPRHRGPGRRKRGE